MTDIPEINPDVFLKAIDVLDERGWGKGDLICKDGSFCALGAISAALGEEIIQGDWGPEFVPPGLGPRPKLGDIESYEEWSRRRAAWRRYADQYDEVLHSAVAERTGGQVAWMGFYNDLPQTTFEDVKDLLRAAYQMTTTKTFKESA